MLKNTSETIEFWEVVTAPGGLLFVPKRQSDETDHYINNWEENKQLQQAMKQGSTPAKSKDKKKKIESDGKMIHLRNR